LKILKALSNTGIGTVDEAFDDFLATLRPSIKLWDYFVNWDKVSRNTNEMAVYLDHLNCLLGSSNFDADFDALLVKNPEVVKGIPCLLVRDGANSQIHSIVEDINDITKPDIVFDFSMPATTKVSRELALKFVKNTGIIRLFSAGGVKSLVDFARGVEAGLDSNGRKNRSGKNMEKIVHNYLTRFTNSSSTEFIPQATAVKVKERWNIVVPEDKAGRDFDFAISDGKTLTLMEVNFYSGSGSKLKSTAGEYRGLHRMLKSSGINFVWVTDGDGWKSTKNPLRDAFNDLDYLWNLAWLNRGYLSEIV